MLEVMEFIFSSVWTFLGTVILIGIPFHVCEAIWGK